MRRTALFWFFLAALAGAVTQGCFISARSSGQSVPDSHTGAGIQKVIIGELAPLREVSHPFFLDTVFTAGDMLVLKVRYSGGCKDHFFSLHSDRNYMKSLPPKLPVLLVHDNNGDACREMVKKELMFDISPLRHERSASVILRLEGYEHETEYRYQR